MKVVVDPIAAAIAAVELRGDLHTRQCAACYQRHFAILTAFRQARGR